MPDTDETTETEDLQTEETDEQTSEGDAAPVAEDAPDESEQRVQGSGTDSEEGDGEEEEVSGGAVQPEAVQASADTRTQTAEPKDPVDPLGEGFYPTEFRGFKVASDGSGLYDEALENPDSEAASTLFESLVEKFDGNEARADLEYQKQVLAYERTKGQYEGFIAGKERQAVNVAVVNVQQQVAATGAKEKAAYDSYAPGLGEKFLSAFHNKAVNAIAEGIQTLASAYIGQGMSPERAALKANLTLSKESNLYADALDIAVQQDRHGYARLLLGVDAPPPPKAADTGTPAANTPPRLTPPPMGAGGGRGGETTGEKRLSLRDVTPDEKAEAESADVDPVFFAAVHRFGYEEAKKHYAPKASTNGSHKETTAGGRR